MLIGCLITAGTCKPFQVALADAGHVVMKGAALLLLTPQTGLSIELIVKISMEEAVDLCCYGPRHENALL